MEGCISRRTWKGSEVSSMDAILAACLPSPWSSVWACWPPLGEAKEPVALSLPSNSVWELCPSEVLLALQEHLAPLQHSLCTQLCEP